LRSPPKINSEKTDVTSSGYMVKRHKLKITVLKRFKPSEVFKEDQVKGAPIEACTVFKDGEEFMVETGEMPKGFCSWAWDDIYKAVNVLRFGGEFPWFEDKGVSVNCCTDGLRPVVFKIERI